ncbi:TonB-dependent siderophore receptor [Roseibacillus persicicus]|uniref:TonB-dependent siderophore receptor n=1 Tax=Roseibacillus persicicus TaxID=454148 RepID=UPI0028107ABC|nr:TonB-dependent siderophore receptor [Roseibacillus persicicus]MDQ8188889.1 TonB-dependent siderophore receptor [Roseibacillus persicicus]
MKSTSLTPTPGEFAPCLGALLLTLTSAPPLHAEEGSTTLPTTIVQAERLTDSNGMATDSLADAIFPHHNTASSSALFAETPLIETPFSVGVYNETLMEDQRAFTLREVLENDSSTSLYSSGGYFGTQNFGLRGFQVGNFTGYRTDGLPTLNLAAPYLDDKASVEVLKGPAALQFGFMPPGGAINMTRKRPTEDFSTSLQFEIDTFGRTYSQIDISDTVANGQFGYRLVLAGEDYESFYDNADGTRFMGSLFTEWNPSEAVTVWSSLSGQTLERNGYYGPIISGDGSTVFDLGRDMNIMQDWARNEHEIFEAAIGADFFFQDDWKLKTAFNYQTTDRDSQLTYPYGVDNDGNYTDGAYLTDGLFEWDAYGAHAHIEGSFRTGFLEHELVFGAQYRSFETDGARFFPDMGANNVYNQVDHPIPTAPFYIPIQFEYEEVGVFLTDTIDFGKGWSALLGGRFSHYDNHYPTDPASDDTESAFSPTVALMFEPAEGVHTYVTYTRALQDGGFANRTANNAWEPLGIQESEQFEVGVKARSRDGRFSGELALFQIEQDVALINDNNIDAFDGTQRHRGVELALRGQLTNELQAGISATLLDAELTSTGNRPELVPEYQVNLWSTLEVPAVPGLAFTANARFTGGQYLDEAESFSTDAYAVVDLGARYKWSTPHADYTLRANIENLLDESYYESGEFYPGDAGYLAYGEPLSANFSLQIDF